VALPGHEKNQLTAPLALNTPFGFTLLRWEDFSRHLQGCGHGTQTVVPAIWFQTVDGVVFKWFVLLVLTANDETDNRR
jgi:hypothetical protein